MKMEANFEPVNYDEQEFRLEITMKLKDWLDLEKCLNEKWPGWKLSKVIKELSYKASRNFMAKTEE